MKGRWKTLQTAAGCTERVKWEKFGPALFWIPTSGPAVLLGGFFSLPLCTLSPWSCMQGYLQMGREGTKALLRWGSSVIVAPIAKWERAEQSVIQGIQDTSMNLCRPYFVNLWHDAVVQLKMIWRYFRISIKLIFFHPAIHFLYAVVQFSPAGVQSRFWKRITQG